MAGCNIPSRGGSAFGLLPGCRVPGSTIRKGAGALFRLMAAAVFLLLVSPAFAADAGPSGDIQMTLVSFEPDTDSVVLALPSGAVWPPIMVVRAEDEQKLAHAVGGDAVTVAVDDSFHPTKAIRVDKVVRPFPDIGKRAVALAISFFTVLALAAVAARGRPQRFLIGGDNRYSNSQCQMAFWFAAIATAYLATVGLRVILFGLDYLGGVGIPENLLALGGLSALSYGGARMITLSKIDRTTMAGAPGGKTQAIAPRFLSDLVQDDFGNADLGDFQMILVTLAAVVLFLLASFHALGAIEIADSIMLPDVDTTLLSGFGLAQAAYLAKKGASAPGGG